MSLSDQLIDLSDPVESTQTSLQKEEIVDEKQASPNEKQVHNQKENSIEQGKHIQHSQHEEPSIDNKQQDDIELMQDSKEDDVALANDLQSTKVIKNANSTDFTKDTHKFGLDEGHDKDAQKDVESTEHVKEDDFGLNENSKEDTNEDVELTQDTKDTQHGFEMTKDNKQDEFDFSEENKKDEIGFTENSKEDDFELNEGNNQDDFEFNEGNKEDDFDDFDDFDNNQDDFDDFDDGFVDANKNDFDDFEATTTPTEVELYVNVVENNPSELGSFINTYLHRMWGDKDMETTPVEDNKDILVTPCSQDLWSKLSRDTVFYNPVTGAIGQFQWTRSETNKAYLNALGVTLNYEDKKAPVQDKKKLPSSPTSPLPPQITDRKRISTPTTPISRPASASPGLRVVTDKMDETTKEAKREADQDMELDIDIARAYCELTEETIRVFPDVKLNAMVIELSRLQRQAADYLDHLLDQREQLKMDAETYNDLISCIVGHAQRLHVNNKDASPAMVSKKKKSNSGTFSNIMRRKTTTTQPNSVSMGGGVVGVKQAPKQTLSSQKIPASESRRSM